TRYFKLLPQGTFPLRRLQGAGVIPKPRSVYGLMYRVAFAVTMSCLSTTTTAPLVSLGGIMEVCVVCCFILKINSVYARWEKDLAVFGKSAIFAFLNPKVTMSTKY
ncbi:MAG: hypothetical protein IJ745_00510, partial [Bacteroidales bacterium]|nr:hypothetical protein [Bacteroidales bacterium]